MAATAGLTLMLCCLGIGASAAAPAGRNIPVIGVDHTSLTSTGSTDTILVSFQDAPSDPKAAASAAVAGPAAAVAHADVASVTPITDKLVSVKLDTTLDGSAAERVGAQVAQRDDVKSADPAATFTSQTDDEYYSSQWNLTAGDDGPGVNAEDAWNTTTGKGAIVAVVDTGITAHADLTNSTTRIVGGNVVPGYDFISSASNAADGGGRDADPTDTGDGCRGDKASWHGTHVAGIIAALGNNGTGIVGVAPGAKVEPLRVLGRCGGSEADVIAAILWAAGAKVASLPVNPNPVDVINLSLGSDARNGVPCSTAMQDAITTAVNRGVVVVAAAGNLNHGVSNASPANCRKVISVGASTDDATLASYSNYGDANQALTVSAPGGAGSDRDAPNDWIISTYNSGDFTPATGSGASTYAGMAGTSMAAPHVSAVAALLKSLDRSLTPAEIRTILTSTASTIAGCSTTRCGAGIVDAAAAVRKVAGTANQTTIAAISPLPFAPAVMGPAKVGNRLTASAGGVTSLATLSYQWWRNDTAIAGATRSTYSLGAADLGKTIRVDLTAVLGSISATRSSNAVTVAAGTFTRTSAPSVSGTVKVGRKVTARTGSWSPSPSSYAYQWYRSGTRIVGAAKATYTLHSADRHMRIQVKVTVSRSGYATAAATSSARTAS